MGLGSLSVALRKSNIGAETSRTVRTSYHARKFQRPKKLGAKFLQNGKISKMLCFKISFASVC